MAFTGDYVVVNMANRGEGGHSMESFAGADLGRRAFSRGSGRNCRMSDHALNEARRDGWVATPRLIEQSGGAR